MLTSPALAWNSTGHEQVADIAWPRLTQQTKNRISDILMAAGDATFRQVGNSSAARRNAFRIAATFPDFIKTHSSSYDSVIPGMNHLWHPETDPLVSPHEKEKCKSWHYYDTPIRFSGPTSTGVRYPANWPDKAICSASRSQGYTTAARSAGRLRTRSIKRWNCGRVTMGGAWQSATGLSTPPR